MSESEKAKQATSGMFAQTAAAVAPLKAHVESSAAREARCRRESDALASILDSAHKLFHSPANTRGWLGLACVSRR